MDEPNYLMTDVLFNLFEQTNTLHSLKAAGFLSKHIGTKSVFSITSSDSNM